MTERWVDIPGYDGRYKVSSEGLILNTETGKFLKPYHRNGYPGVTLHAKEGARRTPHVHAVVLTAFTGLRPDGYVGAHLDGDPTNNRLDNLAWVTPAENERHKIDHGAAQRGSKSCKSKFSDPQISVIREAHRLGLSGEKLSLLLGVSNSAINHIVRGITYQTEAPSDLRPLGIDPSRWELSEEAKEQLRQIDAAIVKPGDPRLDTVISGPQPTPDPVTAARAVLELADSFEQSGKTLFHPEQYPAGYLQAWEEAHRYCARDLRTLLASWRQS